MEIHKNEKNSMTGRTWPFHGIGVTNTWTATTLGRTAGKKKDWDISNMTNKPYKKFYINLALNLGEKRVNIRTAATGN